jgi:hypothetical protein
MTKREADRVERYLDKLAGISIQGRRVWPVRGGYSYEIQCTDTTTGYPFIVRSMDEVKEMVREAKFWADRGPIE